MSGYSGRFVISLRIETQELRPTTMNFRIYFFSLYITLFLSSGAINAQEREDDLVRDTDTSSSEFRIGIAGEVSHDIHSGNQITQGMIEDPSCPVLRESTNRGYSFGLVGVYQINNRFSLRSDVRFATHTSLGSEALPAAQVMLPNQDDPGGAPVIVEQTVTTSGEWTYNYTMIDLLGRITIARIGTGHLLAESGIAYGWQSQTTSWLVQNLEGPTESRFINQGNYPTDNGGQRLILKDEVNITTPSRFSIRGGIGYELPLLSLLYIQPAITFDLGLTDVEEEWRMNALSAQLSIMMEI